MTPPDATEIFGALDATWAPARFIDNGPWRIREGKGGGQRVSSATALGTVSEADIPAAEDAMRSIDQHPIFMIRPGENGLDGWLAQRDYEIVDPVSAYAVPLELVAQPLAPAVAMPSWPPLAVQAEIWSQCGIGPARLAVMDRSPVDKTAILGRSGDAPAGTAYVGVSGRIAMIHALEVLKRFRRRGIGGHIVTGAANWAMSRGAEWLVLVVVSANAPAISFYEKLGMTHATHYHYRRAKGFAG